MYLKEFQENSFYYVDHNWKLNFAFETFFAPDRDRKTKLLEKIISIISHDCKLNFAFERILATVIEY